MPCEIIPNLWIAAHRDITQTFIKSKRIVCIINCSNQKNNKFINESLDFPINSGELVRENFEMILQYIHSHLCEYQNNGVVIYCMDGKMNSPLVALLYVIKYGNIERNRAIQLFRTKYPLQFNIDMDYFLKKYY